MVITNRDHPSRSVESGYFMFSKDSRTENFLTQMGVDFKYSNNVSFSDFEDGWENINLARPVPVREEAVLEYASLMESGSAAPAPIVLLGQKMRVLDGVQRLSAAKLNNVTKLSAYLVTCDSEDVVAAIRVLANARLQGRAEPAEWTRRRAVEVLIVQRGLSASEVAVMGGWRKTDIERLASVIEWSHAIQDIGGPELPDTMINVIAQHTTKKELSLAFEPITEFLNVLKDAKFSAADADQFVADFFAPITKSSRRYRQYASRLDAFKESPEVKTRIHGRQSTPLKNDVVLLRTLKSAVTQLDAIIESGEKLPYADEFFHQMKIIDEKLREITPNPESRKHRVPADMWSSNE